MKPKEQNILATLNLLALLFRARKQNNPKIHEVDKHILTIKKEHLEIAGLTLPVFFNTLELLDRKGYVIGITVFEKKTNDEIMKLIDDEEYKIILKEIEKVDSKPIVDQLKQGIMNNLEKVAPMGHNLNKEDFMSDEFSLKDILDEMRQHFVGHTPDVMAKVFLLPFRDINTLLEKMNDGIPFDEIEDDGFWYDRENYEFHIDGKVIRTYRGEKPNREHFVLNALFQNPRSQKLYYDSLPKFDLARDEEKESGAFRDALKRFIAKNPKLSQIMTPHMHYVDFHPEEFVNTP